MERVLSPEPSSHQEQDTPLVSSAISEWRDKDDPWHRPALCAPCLRVCIWPRVGVAGFRPNAALLMPMTRARHHVISHELMLSLEQHSAGFVSGKLVMMISKQGRVLSLLVAIPVRYSCLPAGR